MEIKGSIKVDEEAAMRSMSPENVLRCGGGTGLPSGEESALLLERERKGVPGRREAEEHPTLSHKQLRQHSVLFLPKTLQSRHSLGGRGPEAWGSCSALSASSTQSWGLLPHPARLPSASTLSRVPSWLPGPIPGSPRVLGSLAVTGWIEQLRRVYIFQFMLTAVHSLPLTLIGQLVPCHFSGDTVTLPMNPP